MDRLLALALLAPGLGTAQDDDLIARIWNGVQATQVEHVSGCGSIAETRTSKLLARPMVLRGKFCAEGMDKFALDYAEPEPLRIRFNGDYLNVTTGREKRTTEVLKIGDHVRRAQSYFSREQSLDNLKRNFVISARQEGGIYVLRLVPKSQRFSKRVNYIVVKLGRKDFLPRSLEVDGASGVNSVWTIQMGALDAKIDPEMFKVYRP